MVVRIEVDALLPLRPEFEFLRKRCYSAKYDRFKIGTMKMAGVISQGIIFSMGILPQGKYKAGEDVTAILDIQAELIGPGIQGNIYGLKEKEIRMFTAKDVVNQKQLSFASLCHLRDAYDIPMVPILDVAKLGEVFPDLETALVRSFMKKSDKEHLYLGFYDTLAEEQWIPDTVLNEGVVVRGVNNEFSFKIRTPQYVAEGSTASF